MTHRSSEPWAHMMIFTTKPRLTLTVCVRGSSLARWAPHGPTPRLSVGVPAWKPRTPTLIVPEGTHSLQLVLGLLCHGCAKLPRCHQECPTGPEKVSYGETACFQWVRSRKVNCFPVGPRLDWVVRIQDSVSHKLGIAQSLPRNCGVTPPTCSI